MSFKIWLESAAIHVGDEIIIGTHGTISRMFPFVGEHSQSDKLKGGGILETNPDMLVMVNPKKRQFARGTFNCFTCKHQKPQPSGPDICDEPFNGEDTHIVTQKWLFETDTGGCVFVDCYPIFGKTQPANACNVSSLYNRISEEAHHGAVFSLSAGGFRRIKPPNFDQPPEKVP